VPCHKTQNQHAVTIIVIMMLWRPEIRENAHNKLATSAPREEYFSPVAKPVTLIAYFLYNLLKLQSHFRNFFALQSRVFLGFAGETP
jgi:hypothetical protein